MFQSSPVNNEITDEDFKVVREFLVSNCGINLAEHKKYLVKTRLERLLGEFRVSSYIELINLAKKGPGTDLLEQIIDKMTTNETLWFRDSYPFSILEEVILPSLLTAKQTPGKIRIWSSAASTGQEAYSIAMVIREFCQNNPAWNPLQFEILATDISSRALEFARKGLYDPFDISRGLPDIYLKKYFNKKENLWEIKNELKSMVEFRHFNLQRPFCNLGNFDVIFCRNVMIYFSPEFKKELAGKFHGSLKQIGYFFLGMTETTLGISNDFETVVCKGGVVYKKRGIAGREIAKCALNRTFKTGNIKVK